MANDYFKFKKFTIWQANCAMKVGTDGTLLGAWANGGRRILDVGTGTGLIALMMAQRFEDTQIVGVDIDEGAVAQARENVKVSPFVDRITIEKADIGTFESQPFDAIISNPPQHIWRTFRPSERPSRRIFSHWPDHIPKNAVGNMARVASPPSWRCAVVR